MATDPGSIPMLPDATSVPDQLIVDQRHLGYVEDLLDGFGVSHAPIDTDDSDDDLELVRLKELKAADQDPLDVGELLALLRQRAAAQRDGWVPVIGRNRPVDAVIGEVHKPMSLAGDSVVALVHKPMSGADPVPALAQDISALAGLAGSPHAGRGVRVGIVDTPLYAGLDGTDQAPLPFRSGHSRFVADLIAQRAPAAEIHVDGVLDVATARNDTWDTARAILRVVRAYDVQILNLSLGCYTVAGGPPLVIARAIERLPEDVLVIAAAGNHGQLEHLTDGRDRYSATWPAAIRPVVAVGARDSADAQPPWSPDLPWVTCTAPGVDVVAAYLKGVVRVRSGETPTFSGYATWSGTSFSTAIVSGAVAARTVPGSVTPQQALEMLLDEGALVRRFV